jgi:hypothetical protein
MIDKDYLYSLGFLYKDEDIEDDTYSSGVFTKVITSNSGIVYWIEYVCQYKYIILKNDFYEEMRFSDIKTNEQLSSLINLIKGDDKHD